MNRMLFNGFNAFFIAGLLVFASCHKKDPVAKTKTQLISQSPWKISDVGIDQNNDGTIDLALPAGILQICVSDNLFTFAVNNIGIIDEGATKCLSNTPQIVPFAWKFLNNETEIDISIPLVAGISGPAKIIELTESKFTISKPVTLKEFPLPIPLTVVVMFIH